MKIKISRKAIARGLLGFIGVQTLAVVGGLCQKYIFPPIKQPLKEELKKISECQSDILYGAISPFRNPIEPMRDENRIVSIALVGTTSATTGTASTSPSGDIAAVDSTIDFPI